MSSQIFIKRRIDGAYVQADVIAGLGTSDLLDLEQAWFPERQSIAQKLMSFQVPQPLWPESLHWRWSRKIAVLNQPGILAVGVRYDRHWQGAMILQSLKPSRSIGNPPLVYIDYAEIAPWNWTIPALQQLGALMGIGSKLIQYAVALSVQQGFQGRIGLHSLPSAEDFYIKLGLTNLGQDPNYENLSYFELSAASASNFPTITL